MKLGHLYNVFHLMGELNNSDDVQKGLLETLKTVPGFVELSKFCKEENAVYRKLNDRLVEKRNILPGADNRELSSEPLSDGSEVEKPKKDENRREQINLIGREFFNDYLATGIKPERDRVSEIADKTMRQLLAELYSNGEYKGGVRDLPDDFRVSTNPQAKGKEWEGKPIENEYQRLETFFSYLKHLGDEKLNSHLKELHYTTLNLFITKASEKMLNKDMTYLEKNGNKFGENFRKDSYVKDFYARVVEPATKEINVPYTYQRARVEADADQYQLSGAGIFGNKGGTYGKLPEGPQTTPNKDGGRQRADADAGHRPKK